MNISSTIRRNLPAIGAFVLVTLGSLLVIPGGDGGAAADPRLPTVVAIAPIPKGALSTEITASVEVRLVAPEARAEGALSSVEEIPQGVVATDHVVGQQLLTSSFNGEQLRPVGEGYTAVSVRLDPQRWAGPLAVTGKIVDVYDVVDGEATLIASDAIIVSAPDAAALGSRDEAIVTIAVTDESLRNLLIAANSGSVWLVGA